MTRDHVEIVRGFYDAWARDEFPPTELMDPEIEYVNPPGAVEPGIRRGITAFRAALENVAGGWASWWMEPESSRRSATRW